MLVCLLAALLGIVALVARQPVSALSHGSSSGTPSSLAGPLGALGAAVAILALALGVYALPALALRRRPPEDEQQPERFPLGLLDRLVIAALPLLLVGLIALAVVESGGDGGNHGSSLQPGPTAAARSSRPAVPAGATNRDGWLAAGAAAAAALVLILGGAVALRRRRGTPGSAESAAVPTGKPRLSQALADLDQDPDPRRAVIRAYAAMETEFGRVGLERQPWEAPREYLGRALRALVVSGRSARRLTGLFEGARFSEERVSERTRREALTALRAVRDELGGHA